MLRVLEWKSEPGSTLPVPTLLDDSPDFPEELVRQVRAWVAGKVEELSESLRLVGPTAQTIHIAEPGKPSQVVFDTPNDSNKPTFGRVFDFEYGTFEVLLRDKRTRMILAKYEYAGARDRRTGKVIIGPQLKIVQTGAV